VTIIDYESVIRVPETALLSESALAEDWDRPEEDIAWSHPVRKPQATSRQGDRRR